MNFFISYPHVDKNLAAKLKQIITQGGHTVWMDDQLTTGKPWRNQLETEIKRAEGIVLALTPNWIDSPYCQWEFITAVENSKKVIPVMLEKTLLPDRISKYQYADLSDGFDDAKVQKLLDDLSTLAQMVDPSTISDMDKEQYAMKIDQNNEGDGQNINVNGSGNTVAGGNIDQSRQSIRIGGSVSGGNVNIGGTQTFHGDVTINYGALPSAPADSPVNELKSLLQELETALKQAPQDKADDVELVQEYANTIAEEAAKESPRKKKLEITGENLMKAAENLAAVAPIAVKIARTLLMIG